MDLAQNIIFHHENWQEQNVVDFLVRRWRLLQRRPFPSKEIFQGQVLARVDQGRWLVDCPNPLCASAMLVSAQLPRFICVECGSPENGSLWYHVIFPVNKDAIEKELLKRPAEKGFYAVTRNWTPGESLYRLRKERLVLEAL